MPDSEVFQGHKGWFSPRKGLFTVINAWVQVSLDDLGIGKISWELPMSSPILMLDLILLLYLSIRTLNMIINKSLL